MKQKLEIDREIVISQLQAYRHSLVCDKIADETDVRLIVNSDFTFDMALGDVSYDTAHGVYCSASVIERYTTNASLAEIADDLIEQVQDQFAEDVS